jgi:excisionase family DNA binding protein
VVALTRTKIEKIGRTARRDAEALGRQLGKYARKQSANLKVEGVMLKLLRQLTELTLKHPGVVITPIDKELSPADAGKILGISRPMVVRKMDAGELPFRYQGKHRRCKLADVLQIKASEERGPFGRQSIPDREVDELVLGTTNAPYKRAVSAAQLAKHLASCGTGPWNVHVATFFTDVRPELILKFAAIHRVSKSDLAATYRAVKAATGEANPRLEAILGQLAPAT